MTVSITRLEHTPADLRREAGRSADARASRRMLALALVMEGQSRETAARNCGMDRQTLRDWVHHYNAEGVAGLSDRPHGGGAPRKLTEEQEAALAEWYERGRSSRSTAWFAGVLLIFGGRSRESSMSNCTSEASASCCAASAFVACRCAHATPRPTRPPSETHKKTMPIWSPPSFRLRPAANRSSSGCKMKPASASKAA